MYSVSDKFLNSMATGGKRKTVADLYYGRSGTPVLTDIPIVDGNIVFDRNSDVRASGSMVIGDSSLLDQFEPWGIELAIRTGAVYPQSEELVPMGMFVVDAESFEYRSGKFPEIEFYDRSHRVSDFETYMATESKFGGLMAQALLERTINIPMRPGAYFTDWELVIDDAVRDVRLPGAFSDGNEDRWALIKKLSALMDAETYFDREGTPRTVISDALPVATIDDAVFEVAYGSNLINYRTKISRDKAYNGVIVTGSTPNGTSGSKPVYALVVDSDVSSKTYWNGPFGRKVMKVSNSAAKNGTEAAVIAKQMLLDHTRLSRTLQLTCLANPALDVGDIISIVYEDDSVELGLVEKFAFDFKYKDFAMDVVVVGEGS